METRNSMAARAGRTFMKLFHAFFRAFFVFSLLAAADTARDTPAARYRNHVMEPNHVLSKYNSLDRDP